MRASSSFARLLLTLALATLIPAIAVRAQAPDPRDYAQVRVVPRADVDRWLKAEILKSGGKFDEQRYHFVLAFSTGHYGVDPVHAIAMRRLAFGLLNNTFAPGDLVTPVAWEMSVWDAGTTVPLTVDPDSRAIVVNQVPYAPRQDSRGGHDTERSLYEVLKNVVTPRDQASTVVLMITNTNQSQVPTGTRTALFGADNKQLIAAIRQGGFRGPIRHSFTAQGKTGPITIDVTALFPTKIVGRTGTPTGPRYPTFPLATWQPAADRPSVDELPNPSAGLPSGPGASSTAPTPPAAPSEEGRAGLPGWLIPAILGLLIIAVGAAVILSRRKPGGEKKPAAPAARTFPGSLRVVLGSAPKARTITLSRLTSGGSWLITAESAVEELADGDAEPDGAMARLDLTEKRDLLVNALGPGQFEAAAGLPPAGVSPRRLTLRPGAHLVCRLTRPGADAMRLEIVYAEK